MERASQRRAVADWLKRELPEAFAVREPTDDEILRYELWHEQQHRCLYTFPDEDAYISPHALIETNNEVQIDHILPRSRSGDDSYRNKVLCKTKSNQDKGRRTPYEWFGTTDAARWDLFVTRIDLLAGMHKEKRRKLLMTTFADREGGYRERHLNDTRFAMRVLRHELEVRYADFALRRGEKRRLLSRPGAITALVRKSWGLNELKRSGELGDRDHALDAIVIASTTEEMLQHLTKLHQRHEDVRAGRHIPRLPTPLGDDAGGREAFRCLVADAARAVFVSRSERRRGRGPAHKATLYGLAPPVNGRPAQVERVAVAELKRADLERLKGAPERTGPLRAALEAWLDKGEQQKTKPAKLFVADPPRMPRKRESPAAASGPAIRHVRLWRRPSQSGITIKRGDGEAHADLDSMVRVDVFLNQGKYYLVPIYAYQVETYGTPPERAIAARPECQWPIIDDTFQFLFTLWPGSLLFAEDRQGQSCYGYFRSCDRSNGRVTCSPSHDYTRDAQLRFTTRTLKQFRKFSVDRFGRQFEVKQEPRLWHGVVCS